MSSGSNSMNVTGQGVSSAYPYVLSVSYSSGSQSIENNQTYISASCTLSSSYTSWIYTNVTMYLYWHDDVSGDVLLNQATYSSGGKNYGSHSLSGARWCSHRSDGTISGCYAWVKLASSSGSYAPNSVSALVTGGDRSFATIPRTTSMSISATSRNLGESITITGSGASSSFTHKLFVLWNGSWIGINTSLGSSVNQSYTIPKSWANNLPNGTSGTATFSLDTYSGSTKIGNSQKSCTIYVPNTTEFNPSISSVAVSEANSSVATQFGFYVQNQSKLKFVSTCSGAYSSSINSIKTTINGVTYTGGTITTNAISASGTVSYTVVATDSRGRSVSKTGSVSVTAYSTPTLSGSAYRCNSSYTRDDNSGTYGQTTYSYNVVTLSNKNTLTFTIDYRVSGGSWTNLKTISSGYSASNATFNMGNVFTATNTYEVRLGIKDFFSSTSYYVMTVSPTYTLINFGAGGKSIAFGQQSSNNGTMEINMPVVHTNYFKQNDVKRYFARRRGADGNYYYWHLCTWSGSDDSDNLIIRIYGGNGYNGGTYQNTCYEIFCKNGWQGTQSATTSFGVTVDIRHYVTSDSNTNNVSVYCRATTHNSCDLYIYFPFTYTNFFAEFIYSGGEISNVVDSVSKSAPSTGTEQAVEFVGERRIRQGNTPIMVVV